MTVELVQENGFPAGETIVAGAALIAAALAAWTAERRLKITLAAQKDQHQAELGHDREMRDLDEMRRTLDDVSSHLAHMRRRGNDLLVAIDAEEPDRRGTSHRVEEAGRQLNSEVAAVRESYERLVLRLGRDDGLAMCLGLVDIAGALISEFSKELSDPAKRPDARSGIEELLAAASYYAGVFTGVARVRFSSQFSDEDDPARFFESLREELEEKDNDTALVVLDSFEKLMSRSEERRGEEEGAQETSAPPST